jgi:phospholipase/carboxylesterase
MKTPDLSLVHLVREPLASSSTAQPPLLLLLHGIGSNEADLFGLAPFLDERFLIVSARAPLTMGPGAYGWFNIEFTAQGMSADLQQARQSLDVLEVFLDEIIKRYRVNERCVYVGGFSQGAMMTLALVLNCPEKVAGVVAMSGRFPSQVLKDELNEEALSGKPFIVTHGIYDPVLPVGEGRTTRRNLEALSVELTYREYPMGHEVSHDSLRDITAWLTRSLDARLNDA